MKKALLILMTAMIATLSYSQKADVKAVEKTIKAFSKAGDDQNADKLDAVLDDNYRVVMNQLFGSKTVSVLPKDAYLGKIRSKEFGGDKRDVTIENVLINGKTASAKVTFKGAKMTFISIITLVKDADGNWLMMSDTPTIAS